MSIQALIDKVPPGGTLTLDPPRAEHQGPVVIRQPLTIAGQGCSFWSERGPVLQVLSSGVVLRDLNVEVTSRESNLDDAEACALLVAPQQGITLQRVVVRGNVLGLDTEEGAWGYPRTLPLGTLKPDQPHDFTLRLNVPVPCTILSEISGLEVMLKSLAPGPVEVPIRIDALKAGTRLRGFLKLQTALVTRQIHVTCTVQKSAQATSGAGQCAYETKDWDTAAAPSPPASEPVSLSSPPAAPQREVVPAPVEVVQAPVEPETTPASPPASMPARRRMRVTTGAVSAAFQEPSAGGTITGPVTSDEPMLMPLWGGPSAATPSVPVGSPPASVGAAEPVAPTSPRARKNAVSDLFMPAAEVPTPPREPAVPDDVPAAPPVPVDANAVPPSPPVKKTRKTRDLPGLFG